MLFFFNINAWIIRPSVLRVRILPGNFFLYFRSSIIGLEHTSLVHCNTPCHDIDEILLKLALNSNQSITEAPNSLAYCRIIYQLWNPLYKNIASLTEDCKHQDFSVKTYWHHFVFNDQTTTEVVSQTMNEQLFCS